MKKINVVSECSIREIENGYQVSIGAECTGNFREIYVFQSFTELVNFLNQIFKHRADMLMSDYQNQTSIILNK